MTITAPPPPAHRAVAPVAPVRGRPALAAWAGALSVVVARVYLGFVGTLALAAFLPLALQWDSFVVQSGSMEPLIGVGDVVVAKPLDAAEEIEVGRVFLFDEPGVPGAEVAVVHRVIERQAGDRWVTQGDANADPDVAPVAREEFRARARILVPFVGLPLRWWQTGDTVRLAGWLLVTALALALARIGLGGGPRDPRPTGLAGRRGGRRSSAPARRRTPSRALLSISAGAALALLVTGPGIGTATAGFSDTTRNPGSSWRTGGLPLQPYNSAVITDDPYFYYLLDEASGRMAADTSNHNRTGTLTSVGDYRTDGALPNNFGYGMALGPGSRIVSGGSPVLDPNTFTLELWFRTTSRAAGKLIGFESTQNATSFAFDRHVTMRPDGRLVYGDWDTIQTRTITSSAAYNDGKWHHLALTAVPRGVQQDAILYVDGQQVASGTTSRTGWYAGWWRVGSGTVNGLFSLPTAQGFDGLVDQVAVYHSALPAARVRAHYAAR